MSLLHPVARQEYRSTTYWTKKERQNKERWKRGRYRKKADAPSPSPSHPVAKTFLHPVFFPDILTTASLWISIKFMVHQLFHDSDTPFEWLINLVAFDLWPVCHLPLKHRWSESHFQHYIPSSVCLFCFIIDVRFYLGMHVDVEKFGQGSRFKVFISISGWGLCATWTKFVLFFCAFRSDFTHHANPPPCPSQVSMKSIGLLHYCFITTYFFVEENSPKNTSESRSVVHRQILHWLLLKRLSHGAGPGDPTGVKQKENPQVFSQPPVAEVHVVSSVARKHPLIVSCPTRPGNMERCGSGI